MDIKKLRKIAMAATPGPWMQERYEKDGSNDLMPHIHGVEEEIAATTYRRRSHTQHIVDATFIATFNPETVLRLLDTIERYESALNFYADAAEIRVLDDNGGVARKALRGEGTTDDQS